MTINSSTILQNPAAAAGLAASRTAAGQSPSAGTATTSGTRTGTGTTTSSGTRTGTGTTTSSGTRTGTGTSGTGTTTTSGTRTGTGTSGTSGTGTASGSTARNGATVETENGQSRIELNQTFDNFLTLLTTQLKNQDPVSPMDTNQFTSQLVQFSQVEQQMKSNDQLQQLIQLQTSSQIAYASSLTGKEVQIEGDTGTLGSSGSIEYGYTLPRSAATVTVNILDSHGGIVFSRTGETTPGRHPVVWDGKGSNGQRAPAGSYRVQVVAKDEQEQPVEAATSVVRTVGGVQLDKGAITLDVGGSTVPLDHVQAIREVKAAA